MLLAGDLLYERNEVDPNTDSVIVAVELRDRNDRNLRPRHVEGLVLIKDQRRLYLGVGRPDDCSCEQINELQVVVRQRIISIEPQDTLSQPPTSDK